jgi:hypothetical protein
MLAPVVANGHSSPPLAQVINDDCDGGRNKQHHEPRHKNAEAQANTHRY